MSEPSGTIAWTDLTIPDAEAGRDFYSAVVGWDSQAVDMGGYSDFAMGPPGTGVAGVCFARGGNAEIHEKVGAAWLLYITVPAVDAAVAACEEQGGALLVGPKAMGGHRYAVLRDPAGAAFAVIESS